MVANLTGILRKSKLGAIIGHFYTPLSVSRQFNTTVSNAKKSSGILKHYKVIGGGDAVNCNVTTDDGWKISTDTPKNQGGTNTAPQPVSLLLASLCGCELATARFVALKSSPRIKMGRIEFDIKAKRDERGAIALPLGSPLPVPARLEHVWGTATVYNTNATQEQIKNLGDEVHLRCPVANMIVLSGCLLEIHWKIAEVDLIT